MIMPWSKWLRNQPICIVEIAPSIAFVVAFTAVSQRPMATNGLVVRHLRRLVQPGPDKLGVEVLKSFFWIVDKVRALLTHVERVCKEPYLCVVVNVAGSPQRAPVERNHRGDTFCSDVAIAKGRVELIAALSKRGKGANDFQWVQIGRQC